MDIMRAVLLDLKKTLSRLLNKTKNSLLYFVVMDLNTIVVKIVVKQKHLKVIQKLSVA